MIMLKKKKIVYNLILEVKSLNFASINQAIFISIAAAKQLLSSVHIP